MAIIQGHAKSSGVTAFYSKTIDQSLRFNFDDNPYLTKTTGAGNRRTYTISLWFKMGYTGVREQSLFSSWNSGGYVDLTVGAYTGVLEFYLYPSYIFRTYRVFRDPSAWYHVVVSVDTTQATASERVKMWLNGEQQTGSLLEYEQQPTQNYDTNMGVASSIVDVGAYYNTPLQEFDGYIAEVHFTDGTAYDADTFGELKSGIWVCKDVAVTYGTNGFHLEFANPAAIGDDTSGNGNDFTANNLVASDVVPDSPTNNFATWNPLWRQASGTVSEGNTSYTAGGSNWYPVSSTISVSSGKWYAEFYWDRNSGLYSFVGVAKAFPFYLNQYIGESTNSPETYGYHSNTGNIYNQSSSVAYGDAWATGGAIIGVALDMDNGAVWFSKDGVWQNSATASEIAAGTTTNAAVTGLTGDYNIASSPFGSTAGMIANFGQDSTFAGNKTAGGNSDANGIGDFAYAPPSGFLALCTANLPDPVIDPAQDATPEDHFNVALYTGASALTVDTGLPSVDMVWIKSRSASYLPRIIDSIRGDDTALYTAAAVAEGSYSVNDDCELNTPTDGNLYFDVTNGGTNGSGVSTVAWAWKAGGTGVSNTDGSITSTVSANTDAGFSIVSYTGNGTAGATVGHGLSSAPEMVITKERGSSGNWAVYHVGVSSAPETDYFFLNQTDQVEDSALFWNDTAPSSSVVTIGSHPNVNRSTENIIMYCFHSVDGFSKVGSYTGNGSATNGTFVYTGFRPKWIMAKRSDSGVATSDWYIWDAERNTFNVAGKTVQANESTAESDSGNHDLDILSNGFKLRIDYATVNGSGNNFIYLAFAEQPFKYSNAR